jgi:carbonic anhydrase
MPEPVMPSMPRRTLLLPALAAALLLPAVAAMAGDGGHGDADWHYAGPHGPTHWNELSSDFATCARGHEQSPIAIMSRRSEERDELGDLDFHYHPGPLRIINNGHTVQVPSPADDEELVVGEQRWKLAQFHFHTPSEEQVDGTAYAMEMHFVHRNAAGELAVVAVLIRRGHDNPALHTVLDNMPVAAGPEHQVATELDLPALLPKARGYWFYEGSLTTPPCSEHVHWYVLKQPIEASPAQVAQFRKLYPRNVRPIQPLHERHVLEHR